MGNGGPLRLCVPLLFSRHQVCFDFRVRHSYGEEHILKAMTDSERAQQEKDVVYNEHKTKAEFNACIVKLQRMQEDVQKCSERLKTFANMLENTDLPIERATDWRSFPEVV